MGMGHLDISSLPCFPCDSGLSCQRDENVHMNNMSETYNSPVARITHVCFNQWVSYCKRAICSLGIEIVCSSVAISTQYPFATMVLGANNVLPHMELIHPYALRSQYDPANDWSGIDYQ